MVTSRSFRRFVVAVLVLGLAGLMPLQAAAQARLSRPYYHITPAPPAPPPPDVYQTSPGVYQTSPGVPPPPAPRTYQTSPVAPPPAPAPDDWQEKQDLLSGTTWLGLLLLAGMLYCAAGGCGGAASSESPSSQGVGGGW